MDFSLRCNSLKCREQLSDRAVVTTCSHIFCIACSELLGLSNINNGGTRQCPACQTLLTNLDDAVVTQLNPTEDYKTSVLSGLSPSIIMECAGRGLSFYSYQTTQEIIYQEFLARSLTDKYSSLSTEMDKIISEANNEIMGLRDKLSAMHVEQKNLEQKNHDLAEAFREKAKNQQQLQTMYSKLKQQQMASGMAYAAQDDAEQTLQAASGDFLNNKRAGQQVHGRVGSGGNGGSGGRRATANAWENQAQNTRNGLHSSRSAPVNTTPSAHRTRLPVPLYGNRGTAMGNQDNGGPPFHAGTPFRQPLSNVDPNAYGNVMNSNYGMSAGVKIGRQQAGSISRSGLGMGRSNDIGGMGIR